jgi:dihydroorotase (multifunctional complex type)
MVVDLTIKNAKLVSSRGIVEGGLAVDEGLIVAVSKTPNLPAADKIIDAKGSVVMPGLIDAHVHTSNPPENSRTGTKAALKGGITTIMEMPGSKRGCFNSKEMDDIRKLYEATSYVDFCIHGGCASGYPEGTLTEMWKQGITGVKFFVSNAGPKWPQTYDGEIIDRFHELAMVDGLALIHAENDQILRDNLRRLEENGRRDFAAHLEWRPPLAEAECGERMIRYLKATRCRGVIVHTSLPETVWNAVKARIEGVRVNVETCPQYLWLTSDDVKERGPWVKFAPPARSKETVAEMWNLVRGGFIDTIASDHAPYSTDIKEEGLQDIFAAPNGIPGLETLLPLMLKGVNEGRIALERLCEMACENPARIHGIYPKKGTLMLGTDGDLVMIDLKKKQEIRNDDLETAVGWTPYNGLEVKGAVTHVIIRGEVVMENSKVSGSDGYGTFVPRK